MLSNKNQTEIIESKNGGRTFSCPEDPIPITLFGEEAHAVNNAIYRTTRKNGDGIFIKLK